MLDEYQGEIERLRGKSLNSQTPAGPAALGS